MADYIEREDALQAITQHGYFENADIVQAIDAVSHVSAADVRPVVHARWLTKEYVYGTEIDDGDGDRWVERPAEYGDCAYCSNCKENAKLDGSEEYALTPFCPNCGAMMDLEG